MRGWVIFSALLLPVFFPALGSAEDKARFQTTEQEIVEELTRVPTRTWGPPAQERSVVVVEKERAIVVKKTLRVSESSVEPRVNLKIEFDYNSYAVREVSFPLLDALGRALTRSELREKSILIKGHTDSDGSDEYNLMLSLNRALSVKQYLLGNFSIPAERLKAIGYGEGMPLVANTTAANKQMNRRVEVQVGRAEASR